MHENVLFFLFNSKVKGKDAYLCFNASKVCASFELSCLVGVCLLPFADLSVKLTAKHPQVVTSC
jgi:hypothetical protein